MPQASTPRPRAWPGLFFLVAVAVAGGCDDDAEGRGDAGFDARVEVTPDPDAGLHADGPITIEAGMPDAPPDAPDTASDSSAFGDASSDGTDADGGADAANGCQIPCLAWLDRGCVPAGACVEWSYAPPPLGSGTRVFANGVAHSWGTFHSSHAMLGNSLFTAKGPDGKTCYQASYGWSLETLASFSFRNAAGETVASGLYDLDGKPAITCNGELYRAEAAATCRVSRFLAPSQWPPVEKPSSPPCQVTTPPDAGP